MYRGRTEKIICFAVYPSLKVYGISGCARLFEVVGKEKEANAVRINQTPHHKEWLFTCRMEQRFFWRIL